MYFLLFCTLFCPLSQNKLGRQDVPFLYWVTYVEGNARISVVLILSWKCYWISDQTTVWESRDQESSAAICRRRWRGYAEPAAGQVGEVWTHDGKSWTHGQRTGQYRNLVFFIISCLTHTPPHKINICCFVLKSNKLV